MRVGIVQMTSGDDLPANLAVAEQLAARGAEPAAADAAGDTPLFFAIRKRHLGITEHLLLPGSSFFRFSDFCCAEPNPLRMTGTLLNSTISNGRSAPRASATVTSTTTRFSMTCSRFFPISPAT